MFVTPASSRHPVDVGQRSEAAIIAALVSRGHRVLLPFGFNQRYDLVLEEGKRFLRVQCKTGRLRNGAVTFATRSVRSNTHGSQTRGYEGEVDAFMVFCPETEKVYAIPAEDAAATTGTLRVDPPANRQAKRIRWARDYELPG